MSRHSAAAILTQVYFQASKEGKSRMEVREATGQVPIPGDTPVINPAQAEILHAYKTFFAQIKD